NQSLAHPLGSNFYNVNFLANYQNDKWMLESEIMYAHYGRDSLGTNLGGNIYQSYVDPEFQFGNKIAQGVKHNLLNIRLRLNYLISKRDDFRLFSDITYYHLNQLPDENNYFLRFGLRINWPDYR
ncbi:MAG: hypothetical protein AAF487_14965, partial [Bacteroidota bacterium]